MVIPIRGNTGLSSYFITSASSQRKCILQSDRIADLLIDVLFKYRDQNKYLLHEFVIMPNHIQLLLTPTDTLEKAIGLIKGGFSYRAKKELGFGGEIWESSFHDWRVRDWEEYCHYRDYVHLNPLKARLCTGAALFPQQFGVGKISTRPLPSAAKAGCLSWLNRSAEALRRPKTVVKLLFSECCSQAAVCQTAILKLPHTRQEKAGEGHHGTLVQNVVKRRSGSG